MTLRYVALLKTIIKWNEAMTSKENFIHVSLWGEGEMQKSRLRPQCMVGKRVETVALVG